MKEQLKSFLCPDEPPTCENVYSPEEAIVGNVSASTGKEAV
jgi:hypothetical protein